MMEILTGRSRREFLQNNTLRITAQTGIRNLWNNAYNHIIIDLERQIWTVQDLSEELLINQQVLTLLLQNRLGYPGPYSRKELDTLFNQTLSNSELNEWQNYIVKTSDRFIVN